MIKLREVKDFLKWQVRRWEWQDYVWMIAFFCIGAGAADRNTVFYLGVFVVMLMMIYNLFKWQWDTWRRERKELLETIKDGK